MSENATPFDQWAIVEVLGHKKYAGHLTEQVICGVAMLRVDVPEIALEVWHAHTSPTTRVVPTYSKLIGPGSIYMITPTTEEIARKAAAVLARQDSDPLPVYIPAERQLATASVGADDAEIEDDEDFPDVDDDFEAAGDAAREAEEAELPFK